MQFGNLWGAPKIFPPWKFAFKVVSGGGFLNDIKMSEVSFSSIRWHYLSRRRDCPIPQAVLWSLPRLHCLPNKASQTLLLLLDSSSLHQVFFFFFLSILSAFQTHREVCRSKPAVVSFSADQIRMSKVGQCSWGKKTGLGPFNEQESKRELLWSPSY